LGGEPWVKGLLFWDLLIYRIEGAIKREGALKGKNTIYKGN